MVRLASMTAASDIAPRARGGRRVRRATSVPLHRDHALISTHAYVWSSTDPCHRRSKNVSSFANFHMIW